MPEFIANDIARICPQHKWTTGNMTSVDEHDTDHLLDFASGT